MIIMTIVITIGTGVEKYQWAFLHDDLDGSKLHLQSKRLPPASWIQLVRKD